MLLLRMSVGHGRPATDSTAAGGEGDVGDLDGKMEDNSDGGDRRRRQCRPRGRRESRYEGHSAHDDDGDCNGEVMLLILSKKMMIMAGMMTMLVRMLILMQLQSCRFRCPLRRP